MGTAYETELGKRGIVCKGAPEEDQQERESKKNPSHLRYTTTGPATLSYGSPTQPNCQVSPSPNSAIKTHLKHTLAVCSAVQYLT